MAATPERYLPDRTTFFDSYRAGQPVGAIIFHDDYYQRETAEWFVASFDDAAELFDALNGPGNTDLPFHDRITLEHHEKHAGGTTIDTITKATSHAS